MTSDFRRRTRIGAALALIASLGSAVSPAQAFCGFYVGKADAKLFNEASQVIMVRDGNRTVIGMRNVTSDRRKLIDIGAAGPLAGLLVAVPVILYGLHRSSVGPLVPGGMQERRPQPVLKIP